MVCTLGSGLGVADVGALCARDVKNDLFKR